MASSRAKAWSAVVSVSTSGVLLTRMRTRGCRGQIDVVVADGHVGDHFEVRRGVENGRVHPIGQQAHQAIDGVNGRLQFSRRHGHRFVAIRYPMPGVAQPLHRCVANVLGDEDVGHLTPSKIISTQRKNLCNLCHLWIILFLPPPRQTGRRGPGR
jgi:hypothetical protein